MKITLKMNNAGHENYPALEILRIYHKDERTSEEIKTAFLDLIGNSKDYTSFSSYNTEFFNENINILQDLIAKDNLLIECIGSKIVTIETIGETRVEEFIFHNKNNSTWCLSKTIKGILSCTSKDLFKEVCDKYNFVFNATLWYLEAYAEDYSCRITNNFDIDSVKFHNINNLSSININVLDADKKYYNDFVKCDVEIYNNVNEAIKNKSSNTYVTFVGGYRGVKCISNLFYNLYYHTFINKQACTMFLDRFQNLTVFYDNEELKNIVLNEFKENNVQLSGNLVISKKYRENLYNFNADNLVLGFNSKTIKKIHPIELRNGNFMLKVSCYKKTRELYYGYGNFKIGIITDSPEAMKKTIQSFCEGMYTGWDHYSCCFSSYVEKEEDQKFEDDIEKWYANCLLTSKATQQSLKTAYENMAKNLKKDKEVMEEYIKYMNLGKLESLPTIKVDKIKNKILKNVYIEPLQVDSTGRTHLSVAKLFLGYRKLANRYGGVADCIDSLDNYANKENNEYVISKRNIRKVVENYAKTKNRD